jgi:hypothetical protein
MFAEFPRLEKHLICEHIKQRCRLLEQKNGSWKKGGKGK